MTTLQDQPDILDRLRAAKQASKTGRHKEESSPLSSVVMDAYFGDPLKKASPSEKISVQPVRSPSPSRAGREEPSRPRERLVDLDAPTQEQKDERRKELRARRGLQAPDEMGYPSRDALRAAIDRAEVERIVSGEASGDILDRIRADKAAHATQAEAGATDSLAKRGGAVSETAYEIGRTTLDIAQRMGLLGSVEPASSMRPGEGAAAKGIRAVPHIARSFTDGIAQQLVTTSLGLASIGEEIVREASGNTEGADAFRRVLADIDREVQRKLSSDGVIDREFHESYWLDRLPRGLGSFATFALVGYMFGPGAGASLKTASAASGTVAGLGGIGSMRQILQQYVDDGTISASTASRAELAGFPIGVVQVLPVIHGISHFYKPLGKELNRRLAEMLKQGGMGGAEEFIVEGLGKAGNNFVEQFVANPNRKLLDGVLDAANEGGGVGFVGRFIMSFFRLRMMGRLPDGIKDHRELKMVMDAMDDPDQQAAAIEALRRGAKRVRPSDQPGEPPIVEMRRRRRPLEASDPTVADIDAEITQRLDAERTEAVERAEAAARQAAHQERQKPLYEKHGPPEAELSDGTLIFRNAKTAEAYATEPGLWDAKLRRSVKRGHVKPRVIGPIVDSAGAEMYAVAFESERARKLAEQLFTDNPAAAADLASQSSPSRADMKRAGVQEVMDAAERIGVARRVRELMAEDARGKTAEHRAAAQRETTSEAATERTSVGESVQESSPQRTAVASAKQVGDRQRVAGIDAAVTDAQRIDGVDYELYRGDDGRGVIRVFDNESGELVSVKTHRDFAKAEAEFGSAVQRAGGDTAAAPTEQVPGASMSEADVAALMQKLGEKPRKNESKESMLKRLAESVGEDFIREAERQLQTPAAQTPQVGQTIPEDHLRAVAKQLGIDTRGDVDAVRRRIIESIGPEFLQQIEESASETQRTEARTRDVEDGAESGREDQAGRQRPASERSAEVPRAAQPTTAPIVPRATFWRRTDRLAMVTRTGTVANCQVIHRLGRAVRKIF